MSKTYPVDHTEEELNAKAAELSQRILAYNPKTGNAENLIKDSVLFNVAYIELQNRAASRTTRQMFLLTWASAVVAAASLVVAWLSYKAAEAGDEWQTKQLKLLSTIAVNSSPRPLPSPVQVTSPSTIAPASSAASK